MSCEACELAQKRAMEEGHVSFYRWKNANVMMVGCDEHLKEIYDTLSKAGNVLNSEELNKDIIKEIEKLREAVLELQRCG